MTLRLKALLKPRTLGRLRYSDSYIWYLITVGPSEQQSGAQEIGPENSRSDSLDPYGQD